MRVVKMRVQKIALVLVSVTTKVCTVLIQEENKILDKMHRQKVAEVEKLSVTVKDLEEALLAGGAAANAIRDHQRQVQELTVCESVPVNAFVQV